MRYRTFGRSGLVVSAVSLCVPEKGVRDPDRIKLITAALETGVNGFEVRAGAEAAEAGLGAALAGVDRNLVIVGARLGRDHAGRGAPFQPEAIRASIQGFLTRARLQKLDYLIIDGPQTGELTQAAMAMLDAAKRAHRVSMIGIGGKAEEIDGYVATGTFDILAAPYNIRSGWAERNRIKAALDLDMSIIGRDYFAAGETQTAAAPVPPKGLARFLHRHPAAVAEGPYEFLGRARGWTPEAICLAFALTEPGIATVQVATTSHEQLAVLGEATERELPSGLPAQIEMARFSVAPAARHA